MLRCKAWATSICTLRIMHPHPESDVMPELPIAAMPFRYVTQNKRRKSCRNSSDSRAAGKGPDTASSHRDGNDNVKHG